MKLLQDLGYVPKLSYRTGVRLIRDGHPEFGKSGVIMAALPNPSERADNQWYDIRFDDGSWGRFLEEDIERIA